jgi:signal peptidase I
MIHEPEAAGSTVSVLATTSSALSPAPLPEVAQADPAPNASGDPAAQPAMDASGEVPSPRKNGWVQRYGPELRSTIVYCLQVLFVTTIIINFVGRMSIVQGGSMEPAIITGERIIVNLLIYDFAVPHRGDVIVFRNPRDESKDYIKRVVGLPGDTVEIRSGTTYLNGLPYPEPYVTLRDYTDLPPVQLAPKELFVMGDNRANSEDSRRWGPLPLRLVRGKASLVFWPPDRMSVFP